MVTLMTAAPSTLPPLGDSEAGGATATAMQPGAVGLVAAATTERSGFSLFFEYIRVAFLAEAESGVQKGINSERGEGF